MSGSRRMDDEAIAADFAWDDESWEDADDADAYDEDAAYAEWADEADEYDPAVSMLPLGFFADDPASR